MYHLERDDEEINEVLNKAMEREDRGTVWPGMSYEQGVSAAIRWMVGDTNDNPMDE